MKRHGAMRRCGELTAATLAMWSLAAGPAWLIAGATGLAGMTLAAALCLVPGWLVFLAASRYRDAAAPVAAVLAGTALRMLFVLGGVLAVRAGFPELGFREFLVWIVVFYLGTLLVETLLLVRGRSSVAHSDGPRTTDRIRS